MTKLIVRNMFKGVLVDTTAIQPTHLMQNLSLAVEYTRVSGAGAGRLYVYGAMDALAATKYLIGFYPNLTGTRDTDGLVAWTTSVNIILQIPGIHPYIYISWDETTDPAKCSVDLYGVETY